MAGKEICVVILDVGKSMSKVFKEASSSRLDKAVEVAKRIYVEKLLFEAKDTIGLVLCGSKDSRNELYEEGQYENIEQVGPLDSPSYDSLEYLSNNIDVNISNVGDLLNAIIVAFDAIIRFSAKKKKSSTSKASFRKRIVLISDLQSPITINAVSELEALVSSLANSQCLLDVVTIDVQKSNEEDSPAFIQAENYKMLECFVDQITNDDNDNGGGTIVSSDVFLERPIVKKVRPTTSFRGELVIVPNTFVIPSVHIYVKCKIESMPSMTLESVKAYQAHRDNTGLVERAYVYTREEEEVDDYLIAYKYGRDYIPFSASDVAAAAFESVKDFRILGCVSANDISIYDKVVGNSTYLITCSDREGRVMLKAFTMGLKSQNSVALARYVRQKNASPKIMMLSPYENSDNDQNIVLIAKQVAFEEDIRDYHFDLLFTKSSMSSQQCQVASDLVDSLVFKFQSTDVYNPALQKFYRSAIARAEKGDTTSTLCDVSNVYRPLNEKLNNATTAVIENTEKFNKLFDLVRAKTMVEKKTTAFWSDLFQAADNKGHKELEEKHDDDFTELFGGKEIVKVGSVNPIADFDALISTKVPSKVRDAFDGMKRQIENMFENGEAYYGKGLRCLQHFRCRCVQLGTSSKFNEFISLLMTRRFPPENFLLLWKTLAESSVTLISCAEDSSIADVTVDSAMLFTQSTLTTTIPQPAAMTLAKATTEQIFGEDEFFDDMD